MRYHVQARIDTDDPAALQPVLERLARVRGGTVRRTAGEFEFEAEWPGTSARDLNRELLTTLRKTVKKTRLRSEWYSEGKLEKFFDYVPKGTVVSPGPAR